MANESDDEEGRIAFLESELIDHRKTIEELRADIIEHENALEAEDNEVDALKSQLWLLQHDFNLVNMKYNHLLYVAGKILDNSSLPGFVKKFGPPPTREPIIFRHQALTENPIPPRRQRPINNINLLPSGINYVNTGSLRALMGAVELLGPAVETTETETQTVEGGMDIEGAGGDAVPPPAEGGGVGGGVGGGDGAVPAGAPSEVAAGGMARRTDESTGGNNGRGEAGGSASAGGGNTTGGTAATGDTSTRSSTGGGNNGEAMEEETVFGVDRFTAETPDEVLVEKQMIAELSKGDKATLKLFDDLIDTMKNRLVEDQTRIVSRRESPGSVGDFNDVLTTLHFARFKLIFGERWQPEDIKDTFGDRFKHTENTKTHTIRDNIRKALSTVKDETELTQYDIGVETKNRGKYIISYVIYINALVNITAFHLRSY